MAKVKGENDQADVFLAPHQQAPPTCRVAATAQTVLKLRLKLGGGKEWIAGAPVPVKALDRPVLTR